MLLLAIPLRALELDASPALVGIIMAAPYLLPLILAIPLGGMVSKAGTQKVFIIGALGMMAAPWLSLAVPTILGLIGTQIFIGLAQTLTVISAQSLVASQGKGRTLERHFSRYSMCQSGGQLIGPLVAGRMIDSLPMLWVFATISLIPIIGLVCACLLAGGGRQKNEIASSLLSYRAQMTILHSNVGVQLSIAVSTVTVFALVAYSAFLPLYLEELAFSATLIGMLVGLRALSAMLIRPLMSQVIWVLGGRSNTLAATVAAVALGLMWTGATDSTVALAMLATLIGIGSGISQPLALVVIAEHVQPQQRPSTLGLRLMANRGGQILSPIILGMLVELFGFTWIFLIAGAGLMSVMVIVIRLAPAFNRKEAANSLQQSPGATIEPGRILNHCTEAGL